VVISLLATASRSRIALGAAVGAVLFRVASTPARGLFPVPGGGVGFVTVHAYPKEFDYFVVGMLVAGALIGGLVACCWSGGSQRCDDDVERPRGASHPTGRTLLAALAVFFVMFFVHDHPQEQMEPFHEGEHLTPGFLFRSGLSPFGEVFVLHGLAVDGGLDALVLGDPPSPRRARRLETVLDAATLALLVPIAAEICATFVGTLAAAVAALCAMAAFWVPVFPYFRLAPLLIAVLALLWFVRTRRNAALFAAMSASTLGPLWSLDTGIYALSTTIVILALLRVWRPALSTIALALPFVLLLVLGSNLRQFLNDSFVVIPHSIDAIWSLPMPTDLSVESARYLLPPALFGMLLVFALRGWARGERDAAARIAIITIASLFAFRSAAGRCGWSHTRYGVPLLGLAVVAFLAEPLLRNRYRVAAVIVVAAIVVYVQLHENTVAGAKLVAGWYARQSHAGLVPYPFRTGRGIYTTPENAADLAALNGFLALNAPPGARVLDVSNERALAYLLERRPATRCSDIAMLSSPPLFDEAMHELTANPPPLVVVSGSPNVDQFDGLPNRQRVPRLFAWIDANYPRRRQVGRFIVATR
jgi:hypothetical protein